jgi:hypothetical protein
MQCLICLRALNYDSAHGKAAEGALCHLPVSLTTTAGDFLGAFFAPPQCLIRPNDSVPVYLKAEEGAIGQGCGVTLLAVDHQFEAGFDGLL